MECEPNSKPRPKPKTSSADFAERGVALIGVRSSGNLWVVEEYVGGRAFYYTYIYGGKRYSVLLFISAVPNTKLCAWGEEDRGEYVL